MVGRGGTQAAKLKVITYIEFLFGSGNGISGTNCESRVDAGGGEAHSQHQCLTLNAALCWKRSEMLKFKDELLLYVDWTDTLPDQKLIQE